MFLWQSRSAVHRTTTTTTTRMMAMNMAMAAFPPGAEAEVVQAEAITMIPTIQTMMRMMMLMTMLTAGATMTSECEAPCGANTFLRASTIER